MPPANRGPTGGQRGGGGRAELLHLTEDFLPSPTGRQREETEEKSKEDQSEKDEGKVKYCLCQLEVREGKEGGQRRQRGDRMREGMKAEEDEKGRELLHPSVQT